MARRLAVVLIAGGLFAAPVDRLSAAPRSRVLRLWPEPLASGRTLGAPLATLDTRKRLDAEFLAGPVALGGGLWRFGLAADAEFEKFYLAVTGRRGTRFYRLARPSAIVSEGQDFALDAGSSFHLTVKPRWSDLLRESRIELAPLPGIPGQPARWRSAELLDLLKRQTSYFRQDGQDFFLAYVSDIDPAAGKRADTRSLVIFAQRRFRSRLWRLPARDLRPGIAARVRLGRRNVVLLLRPDGLLVVYAGG